MHPTDRVVTVYRLDAGRYTRPAIHEMKSELAVGVLPQVNIDWAGLER